MADQVAEADKIDPSPSAQAAGPPTDSGTLEQKLARLDPAVQMYLRDLLRGLEAEAGNARAMADLERQQLNSEIQRLAIAKAKLQDALDSATAELEQVRSGLAQTPQGPQVGSDGSDDASSVAGSAVSRLRKLAR